MLRYDIDEKYKWDLEKIYKNLNEFKKDYEEIKKGIEKLCKFNGKICQSAKSLEEFLKLDEKVERKIEKLYVYASLKSDENTRETANQELKQEAMNLYSEFIGKLSFVKSQILKEDYKLIEKYLEENENLKIYKHYFKDLFRNKNHILSDKEEKIIASYNKLGKVPENTYMLFTNADLKFPYVLKGDKKIEITNANFTHLQEDKDRNFRKEVYEKFYSTYKQFQETSASLLNGELINHYTQAKLRNFESSRQMALFTNNISEDVYDNLIDVINDNLDINKGYISLRKEILNLNDLAFYDIYMPLVSDYNLKYSFEEAKEIILEALKPLGNDYVNNARRGFESRWFDVCPNEGKRSGAYSSGSYDTEPYILLNYNNTLDSLFTTVHELGHSMHSYYTNTSQPYIYSSYSIFLAEIASTTNELLLLNYMLDNTENKNEKAYLLNHYVNSFKSTIFRQAMFAEFEHKANLLVGQSKPINGQILDEIYKDLNIKYYGKDIKVDEYISCEWTRIPHFYMFYYVYQYATGFSSAVTLSNNILHGSKKDTINYLDFLKAGNSAYPLEILKRAGVDMTKKDDLQKAMNIAREKLDELNNILK